ncbi:monomeric sarcosine oxidase-like, partial [Saccoglossus kowalevskii]
VLGLERFTLGHERGGSQDHARIIRIDYHDDDYIPLVRDSYTTIQDVERESGLKLIHITGEIMMVKKDDPRSEILGAYEEAMTKANLKYEIWNQNEIQRRFPQFCLESNVVGLYTKDSGLVDAAMTNAAHIQLARRNGATIEENCQVLKMEKDKDGVHVLVHTTKDMFCARHVIVTAGGWTNQVLSSLDIKLPLTITQEQATFVATPNLKDFTKNR